MYALCDCNNFFVSCERVFRPDLEGKPVVVLSGNDGCVVSRSNEAKAMGIKMGVPYFEIEKAYPQPLPEGKGGKNAVTAFSSNFALYGDLSNRVMSILKKHTYCLEQYSVDEAFMHTDHLPIEEQKQYYEQVVKQVRQWVGIPISIGIAPTKTLAKIASKFAKKYPAYKDVCIIDTAEKRMKALQLTPVEDVWGIGRQAQKKMAAASIQTAWELSQRTPEFVRGLLNKPGLQTWQELNGIDCIDISDHAARQSISQSRTFQTSVSDRARIEAALVEYMSYCAEKMRKQKSECRQFAVYAHTSRFAQEEGYSIHQVVTLPYPTAITTELVGAMLNAFRKVWRPFAFKKAGVVLMNLSSAANAQQVLFDERDEAQQQRQQRLQQAIDHINEHHGQAAIKLATQLTDKKAPALTKKDKLSPQYTTRLSEIMVVRV